jgi:hypothetical protein
MDEVHRRRLASYLHGCFAISLRGFAHARDLSLDELAWRSEAVNAFDQTTTLVARGAQPCGLYCTVQLGVAAHVGIARSALSRSLAGVGVIVGRATAEELEDFATLRRGDDRTRGSIRIVLSGVESFEGRIMERRSARPLRERDVDALRTTKPHTWRSFVRRGSQRAHDVARGIAPAAARAFGNSCNSFGMADGFISGPILLHHRGRRRGVRNLEQRARSLARKPRDAVQQFDSAKHDNLVAFSFERTRHADILAGDAVDRHWRNSRPDELAEISLAHVSATGIIQRALIESTFASRLRLARLQHFVMLGFVNPFLHSAGCCHVVFRETGLGSFAA